MKLLISGSHGLVGTALCRELSKRGHHVARLVRQMPASGDDVGWNIQSGKIEMRKLSGFDVVLHLAGKSIASGRWSEKLKREIFNSRVRSSALLAESLRVVEQKPRCFICASAIGFYGSRGDEELNEASLPGDSFLSRVCREWEAATDCLDDADVRVVNARFGAILSPRGGALRTMLFPFRLGLGGRLGDGQQFFSWISIDDVVGGLLHCIETQALAGPVNFVAPEAVRNQEFTETLGKVLRRPTPFPVPKRLLQLALGEMADELLLASARVRPTKLITHGYNFEHPKLEIALRALLA